MHWLDPDYLPETSGSIRNILVNPHGEIDGLVLEAGVEVHLPPHLSTAIAKLVKIGENVSIRGVKPRDAEVIAAVSLEARGKRIVDDGPTEKHKKHEKPKPKDKSDAQEITGEVEQLLHGPKGEARGVLLTSGEALRFPKHAAGAFKALLKPGSAIAARGHLIKSKHGQVLETREMGADLKRLKPIPKPPKPGHKHQPHG